MSKTKLKPTKNLQKIKKYKDVTEYVMPHNGLRVLYVHKKGSGVVTTNVLYKVGARDEEFGATGVAHMLEHMLFKPTKQDLKKGIDSAAMDFERNIGCVLNANTWKDRTTYYFCYPIEHFERALTIEAERMYDVVLSDKEFQPERTNVLSEYDMHAGDEEFALSVAMVTAAFQSHPYGHETIGFRQDIENYTVAKLERFYRKYYATNNATLMVVGDISEKEMITTVEKVFSPLKPSQSYVPREEIIEPKQEGIKTVVVNRPSTIHMLGIGLKHQGFPSKEWFTSMVALELLAGGEDSILHKKFVDTHKVISVTYMLEPTKDPNLAILFVKLIKKGTHDAIYNAVRDIVMNVTVADIKPKLTKVIQRNIVREFMNRENTLGYVAELVEYESSGHWEAFFKTEEILKSITAQDVLSEIKNLFNEDSMTIGKFVGKAQ